MYAPLGPTVGAVITIGLEEVLRIAFGTEFTGGAPLIYGILLVLFMIYLPRGLVGIVERKRRRPAVPLGLPAAAK
jgi:branched-chain amino acid transport system permease protein